jgi:hypothetical protein
MHTIKLYHLGYYCPWCESTQAFLQAYCARHHMPFSSVDIQTQKAQVDGLVVFPFNTAVDGTIITGSPVFKSNVEDLFQCTRIHTQVEDKVLPNGTLDAAALLSEDNINDSVSVCTDKELFNCRKKQWFTGNSNNIIGFIGYKNNSPTAILETMKSEACAFTGIIQNDYTATILCCYSNPDDYDYKYDLLEKSIATIKARGMSELEAIVGEHSYYPNGTLQQFEDYGFVRCKELGTTYLLHRGHDSLWLVKKTL